MPSKRKLQSTRRAVDISPPKPRILIVCEGKQTEPNYFKAFRVTNAIYKVTGTGHNTVSLVNKADELQTEQGIDIKDRFDQVWCVFDLDDFPHFDQAIHLAHSKGFKVAYSNQAFEIWYLLHFHYFHTALERSQYYEKLTELIGKDYSKSASDMYEILLSRQSVAIDNAQRLLAEHSQHLNPSKKKPSTTVHELVQELNKYIR